LIAVDLQPGGVLLVVDVREPLEEDQREDELLVVPRVDETAQQDRRAPQVGLEFALGDPGAHAEASAGPRPHLASSASSAALVSRAAAWAASRSASACSSVVCSPSSVGWT